MTQFSMTWSAPDIRAGVGGDFRRAFRQLLRQPAFAAVIVLTLGGAMGVNASLFAAFSARMLRPWAVPEPDRMVVVLSPSPPVAEWRQWSEQTRSLSGLVMMLRGYRAQQAGERRAFDLVSANFFSVLRVPVERGRAFLPGEDLPGAPGDVAIISHRAFERDFASDPSVIGRSIELDAVPFTIVGVASQGFDGVWPEWYRTDLWLPLAAAPRLSPQDAPAADPLAARGYVAGRLAPGFSRAEAEAELTTLHRRQLAQPARSPEPVRLHDTTPYDTFARGGDVRVDIFHVALFLGMTFITLIACANVANLMLARGYARRGEIAVRLALGAPRIRVVRQLLVEALVLAGLAGALGLAIAGTLPEYVLRTLPGALENSTLDFRFDSKVFAYGLGLAAIACVVFGLAPALACTRISVGAALKDANGLSIPALKSSLPGYQVVLSVILLAVAGLLLRSVQHAHAKAPGYSVEDVTFLRVDFPRPYTRLERETLSTRFQHELENLAGSENVSAATVFPGPGPGSSGINTYFDLRERGTLRQDSAGRLVVSPSYFDVLGIPMERGRGFRPGDSAEGTVIVNQAFVRRFWPDENPLGKTLAWNRAEREVIGVVRDAHLATLDEVEPMIFSPAPDREGPGSLDRANTAANFLVRRLAVSDLARQAPGLMARLDGRARVEVRAGSTAVETATQGALVGARVVGALAMMALALATFGLFSVSAYVVQQRTREIGVRMALGAQPKDVLRTVLGTTAATLVRGTTVGTMGAMCASFAMRHWFFGLHPLDPVTYLAVAAIAAGSGLLASYLPARRALGVDPVVALRYE